MRTKESTVNFVGKHQKIGIDGATGVSLHCHTVHSKEILDFVPYYAERIPFIAPLWRRKMQQLRSVNGALPDFQRGYWEPPLQGRSVVESETVTINNLGLKALVSITDHDTIAANLELRTENRRSDIPISMEWTVPFENAFFHVGVHNLPIGSAEVIAKDLLDYTYDGGEPNGERLSELFRSLHELPEILVVLNHPIWDIEMIGQSEHEAALWRFLEKHEEHIHAIEVNGFRSWSENQAAVDLAESRSIPLISGGDRHCCQPNTMINVTNAASFSEFVDDIRTFKTSQVVVLPDYSKPLPTRQLASIANILSDYRHADGTRMKWSDRVYLDHRDGNGKVSLREHWNGRVPIWATFGVSACRLAGHRYFAPFMNILVGDIDIGRNETSVARDKGFQVNGTVAEA
ncbi:MAG: hypothetical protein JNL64_05060 [Blastocatellia bacterium]|nr:hypothetical protein [Blastocatellia bacterium]